MVWLGRYWSFCVLQRMVDESWVVSILGGIWGAHCTIETLHTFAWDLAESINKKSHCQGKIIYISVRTEARRKVNLWEQKRKQNRTVIHPLSWTSKFASTQYPRFDVASLSFCLSFRPFIQLHQPQSILKLSPQPQHQHTDQPVQKYPSFESIPFPSLKLQVGSQECSFRLLLRLSWLFCVWDWKVTSISILCCKGVDGFGREGEREGKEGVKKWGGKGWRWEEGK